MSDTEKDNVSAVASALLALSDPARLRVFRTLRLGRGAEKQQAGIGEDMAELTERIAVELNISPLLVEQQLLELQRAGLLTCVEGRGGALTCRADEHTLAVIQQLLCETLGKADSGGRR